MIVFVPLSPFYELFLGLLKPTTPSASEGNVHFLTHFSTDPQDLLPLGSTIEQSWDYYKFEERTRRRTTGLRT